MRFVPTFGRTLRMLGVLRDTKQSTAHRMDAATWLADRGWGRPGQAVQHTGGDDQPVKMFHDRVPFEFVDQVFDVIGRAPHYTFQVLTKRPDRLVLWHCGTDTIRRIPTNAWLGVSVESTAYTWRVDRLRAVDSAVRFVSAEPLLGSLTELDLTGIAWVITGGESGGSPARALVDHTPRGWQPKPVALRWIRELRDRCVSGGVAFFHKQWGGPRPTSGGRFLDGRTWSQYPAHAAPALSPKPRRGREPAER